MTAPVDGASPKRAPGCGYGCGGCLTIILLIVVFTLASDRKAKEQRDISDAVCRTSADWRNCESRIAAESITVTNADMPVCPTERGLDALNEAAGTRDTVIFARTLNESGCFYPPAGVKLSVLENGFARVKIRLQSPSGDVSPVLWAPREIVREPTRR